MGKSNILVSGLFLILFLIVFSPQNVNCEMPSIIHYYGVYANITNISEDGDFLWVSTNQDGIRKFNTITGEYEIFNSYNSELNSNYISCSIKDFQNNIWIATNTGIFIYQNNQIRNLNYKISKLLDDKIISLNVDSKGQVWVTSKTNISTFDGSKFTNYNFIDTSMSYNSILGVQIDKNDKIWILTTHEGIVEIDGKDKIVHTLPDSLKSIYNYTNFTIDNENNLWFGLSYSNLIKFDVEKNTFIKNFTYNTNGASYNLDITFDRNGKLIINGYGLNIFDGTNWNKLPRENSQLYDDCISEIFVDSKNNYWLGTCNSELVKIENSVFKYYDLNCETLIDNKILAYSLNHKNEFSVLTSIGINVFSVGGWKTYTPRNSIIPANNYFFDKIIKDESGNLWIASYKGCIVIKNSEIIDIAEKYPDYIQLPVSKIFTNKNYVYVESYKGLAKFDGTNWEMINNDGLSNIFIMDNKNKLWSFDGSYMKYYDGANWISYTDQKFPEIENIDNFKLAFAKNGNIWVNTEKYLAKYSLNKWEVFNFNNLPYQTNVTWLIKVDSKENIWLLSMEGDLAKFDGTKWTIRKNLIKYSGTEQGYILGLEIDSLDNIFIFTDRFGIYVYHENGIVLTEVTENFNFAKNELNLYPNPASDFITICSDSIRANSDATVKIFDVLGIELITESLYPMTGSHRINIGDLSAGVYFIKIGDKVEKFVKN